MWCLLFLQSFLCAQILRVVMQLVFAGFKARQALSTCITRICFSSRPSWEFLFAFLILIYTSSAILLMVMARCLNSLPVIQETLLRARAEALESMMLYVFIYIIYGLCIGVLYGLNVMINHHFKSWTPRFVSSTVLELVTFFSSSHIDFLHFPDFARYSY